MTVFGNIKTVKEAMWKVTTNSRRVWTITSHQERKCTAKYTTERLNPEFGISSFQNLKKWKLSKLTLIWAQKGNLNYVLGESVS